MLLFAVQFHNPVPLDVVVKNYSDSGSSMMSWIPPPPLSFSGASEPESALPPVDKFDQQLQAYKDAGNSLTLAKSGVEMATASMHEAKDKLSEASDKANTVTKAIEAYIGKVKDITVKAKVDDADMEQAINNRKKLIENESKLLEDHRKENKEILTRHFYDMSNMMSRNEGVWLSNGWVMTLLWIFLPCFLYTVISIVYFVASCIDK